MNRVLICGGPGSGKTTLLYEYLYRGAAQYNDKGLFVSLEQSPERLIKNAKALFSNWEWDRYLRSHITITRINIDDFNHLQDIIGNYVEKNGIRRVVIDSLTLLRLYFRADEAYRSNLFELLTYLGDLDCTCLLALEKSMSKRSEVKFDMEEFLADGVLNMYLIPKERDRLRVLEILKMRETNHSTRLCPFKITSEGIMISSDAQMFGDIE